MRNSIYKRRNADIGGGKNQNWTANVNLISKYRSLLMGIGIIEVMMQHFLTWNIPDSFFFKIFVNTHLIFTQGFLLLSGLGLYYSYNKNGGLRNFYIRRIKRMFIPYMLMAIPFVSLIIYFDDSLGWDRFLGWVTAIGYFVPGQINNMWYIALSMILYAIFPLIYRMLTIPRSITNNWINSLKIFLIICLLLAFSYYIKIAMPNYYSGVEPAFTQFPSFFIGILIGSFSKQGMRIPTLKFFLVLILLNIVFFMVFDAFSCRFLFPMIRLLLSIPLVCIICELISTKKYFLKIESLLVWFGKYSLELYVIHLMLMKLVKNISPYTIQINTIIVLLITFVLLIPMSRVVNRVSDYIFTKH